MQLILWRHADAEDAAGGDDLARALTRKGRKQAERMAQWLRPQLAPDWLVLASPARRALETARALTDEPEERSRLAPGARASDILEEVGWPDHERPVVVVGHQPTLGQVAGRLLGARHELAIRKAAMWWFAERGGETVLLAVLDPDRLPR